MLNEAASMFQDELNPGERLLWTGRPKQGLMLRRSDWIMVPLSLWWVSSSLDWLRFGLESGATAFDAFSVVFLVLFNIYFMAGPVFPPFDEHHHHNG